MATAASQGRNTPSAKARKSFRTGAGAGYDGVGNQTSVLGTAGESALYDTENRLATAIEPNVERNSIQL